MPTSRKNTASQGDGPSERLSSLTAAEAEVMNVVWSHEPISMPEIVERLQRPLAYSTVMTTVRILEEKGFLAQNGKKGRAFVYKSVIEQGLVRGTMVRELAARLFDGSLKSLAMSLIQDQSFNGDDIQELKVLIEKLESEK